MKKIRKTGEKIIGRLNGKRVKLTAKKWETLMEDKENIIVFKEDK
jgi:hypothetical protein